MLNLALSILSNLIPSLLGPYIPIVWAFIKKHWRAILFDLVIVAAIFSGYEWRHTSTALKTEKVAHQADIKAFKSAQAQANKNAQDIKNKLETESKAHAKAADQKYNTLFAQYHANLLRYQAYQSGTKQSSNSQLPTAQSPVGPGTSADISPGSVTISLDDANICAVNTAKLEAAHEWALSIKGQ